MASFRFSVRARDDLRDIGEFTTRTWNEAQAVRYLAELEDHARALIATPALGRQCEHIRPEMGRDARALTLNS